MTQLTPINFDAPVDLQAAADDAPNRRPTFRIQAYNGGEMRLKGFRHPVVVDLATAQGGEIPILRDHDPTRIVGQGLASITAHGITIEGTVTGDDADAQGVVTHAKNGFRWQASIGSSEFIEEPLAAGKTAVVNGRTITGPKTIARNLSLGETSLLARGADKTTSATIAASSHVADGGEGKDSKMFEQWLTAKGIDAATLADGAIKNTLKAQYDAEQKPAVAAPAAPIQAAAPEALSSAKLDTVLAEFAAKEKRQDEIARITREALEDAPGCRHQIEAAARKASDEDMPVKDFELEILRATRSNPQVHGRRKNGEQMTNDVIEAALCRATGVEKVDEQYSDQVLTACDRYFRDGIGLQEALVIAANDRGAGIRSISGPSSLRDVLEYALPRRSEIRASGGFSSISLPNILANVQNKHVRDAFMFGEQVCFEIAEIESVTDFKAISNNSLTGDLTYKQLSPTGEIPHGTLGEKNYANQAKTYGKMLAITREQIINDDLSAFAKIPKRLGRGAILAINEVFWTEFMNNSTFFTTGNLNYDDGTDTALDVAGLTKALGTFWAAQTDPDGKPLGSTPRILLVPPAQEIPALNLMNGTALNPSGQTSSTALVSNNNPFQGRFAVKTSTYLANSSYTGYSALAWYLLCDPRDIPVIQIVFLNGRRMPVIETADADFDTLGIQIRAYHDFGVAKQEFRGGMKFKGEA